MTPEERKIDEILAEYFTWKGEAITAVNQTSNYKRMKASLLQMLVEAGESKGYPWSESRVAVGETINFHGVITVTNNNDADILVAMKRAEPRLTKLNPKEKES